MPKAVVAPALRPPEERTSLRWSPHTLALAATLAIVALLYAAPYLWTAMRGGSSQLPPVFGPDLYFYLNISRLHASPAGTLLNPWYGVEVPAGSLAYWKFRSGFAAFNLLRSLLGGHWSVTLLCWSAGWALLIAIAGIYVCRKILPPSALLLSWAVLFLLLFDVTLLPASASAWIHASLIGFRQVRLPFSRTFFPQIAVPFVLFYLGLQIEVLRSRKRALWGWMAVSQFIAFTAFPYTTLLLAGTTAIVAAVALLGRRLDAPWREWVGFAVLCGALDSAYLLLSGASHAATAVTVRDPLFSFSLGRLPFMLQGHSKMLLLLVVTTAACAAVAERNMREAKWVMASLGTATLLLSFADLFVNPMLQVSDHILYFMHVVLALLLVLLAGELLRVAQLRGIQPKWALAGLLVLVVVHGTLSVAGNFLTYSAFNRSSAQTAALFASLQLHPNDLVMAPADSVDDVSCWLPLSSSGRVLYCFNAELVLEPANKASYQRVRQGLYLYFSGREASKVSDLLSRTDKEAEERQWWYAQIRERMLFHDPIRGQMLSSLRDALVPELRRLEASAPGIEKFFASYDRIVVVDSASKPTFVPDRLQKYLQVESESVVNGQRVRWCKARPSS